MDRPSVLTIAGSDCSGGAGIQADLKTMLVHGVYGMSAITALTAQNTQSVSFIEIVDSKFLDAQLSSIFEDIMPNAIKIGMISNSKQVEVIASKINQYQIKHVVVDPVMISTSGCELSNNKVINSAIKLLFPISSVITPNIPEAKILANQDISDENDMLKAAKTIFQNCHCPILLKGGHLNNSANDLLYDGINNTWFRSKRVNNPNTHGTGCTLSSSIACNLALGYNLTESVRNAKAYLSKILKSDLNLGKSSGPLDHGFDNINTNYRS